MTSLKQIEKEVNLIKQRNKRVEADKAWETSKERKIVIAILTYFVISLFFYFARIPEPFINAIVPSLAFLLSTLSLPFFKEQWKKHIYKR